MAALPAEGGRRRGTVLIDRYLFGTEVDVDAISDGETVVIPGLMEHVERAGVHSGDSMAAYPARILDDDVRALIVDATVRITRALDVRGLCNIQFAVHRGIPHVLEVNPRASRTVPFLSKVTGVPMVELATRVMRGATLAELGWTTGLVPARPLVAVKAPVFSTVKLIDVDTALGPEMKSTGEVMGIDTDLGAALEKAFVAALGEMPTRAARCAASPTSTRPRRCRSSRSSARSASPSTRPRAPPRRLRARASPRSRWARSATAGPTSST